MPEKNLFNKFHIILHEPRHATNPISENNQEFSYEAQVSDPKFINMPQFIY
jgi:hypothetical protein